MLIDHFNKAIIYPNLDGRLFNRISDLFDILGRIAFPIFIFIYIFINRRVLPYKK